MPLADETERLAWNALLRRVGKRVSYEARVFASEPTVADENGEVRFFLVMMALPKEFGERTEKINFATRNEFFQHRAKRL